MYVWPCMYVQMNRNTIPEETHEHCFIGMLAPIAYYRCTFLRNS